MTSFSLGFSFFPDLMKNLMGQYINNPFIVSFEMKGYFLHGPIEITRHIKNKIEGTPILKLAMVKRL